MQAPSPPSSRRPGQGPVDVRECSPVMTLAKRARKREQLDLHLRRALPAALRDHVRLADLKNGRLVFLAPSPAWASRLRLAQTQILAAAHALGVKAQGIGVKVAPPVAAPVAPVPARVSISPAAANHLQTAARSLSDPELRDLFLALASFTEKPDSPHET